MEQRPLAILEHLQGRLVDKLLSRAQYAGLARVATCCPPVGSSFYIETRLSGQTDQTDYLFAVTRERRGQFTRAVAELLGRRATAADSVRVHASEPWGRVARFCDAWSLPSGILSSVPQIWLELDDVLSDQPPKPSLCVCLLDDYRDETTPLAQDAAGRDLERLLAAAALVRHDTTASLAAFLRRCASVLPAQGALIHASFMIGRTPERLKLYGVTPLASLWTYLETLGHHAERARSILGPIYADGDADGRAFFDLIVRDDGSIDPDYLGLAFSQQQLFAGDQSATRRATLEVLLTRGLAKADQVCKLTAWPGQERCVLPKQAHPTTVRRWLDLKLVWNGGSEAQAKAYLGFSARASLF